MVAWNVLEVVVDATCDVRPHDHPGYLPVEVRIDGRDFIEMVREVELPFAIREWDERAPSARIGERGARAGKWMYLYVKDVLRSPLGLLEAPDEYYARGKSWMLQCSCHCFGCKDLLARVELDEASATWSHF